jgi:hypothetical protein
LVIRASGCGASVAQLNGLRLLRFVWKARRAAPLMKGLGFKRAAAAAGGGRLGGRDLNPAPRGSPAKRIYR